MLSHLQYLKRITPLSGLGHTVKYRIFLLLLKTKTFKTAFICKFYLYNMKKKR